MRPPAELPDEYWYYFVQRLWGVVIEFRTFSVLIFRELVHCVLLFIFCP